MIQTSTRQLRHLLWAWIWLLPAMPARALIYTYDNTTAGAVDNVATPCANPLVRSFTVTDSFTVSSIAVGLNVTHPDRGDLRVTLVAPNNATLQVVTEDNADTNDNYDIHLSTNSEGTLNDGDVDPVAEPFYNRLVSFAGLAGFYTGNAAGTWSLRICDTAANNAGTFNRARLVLASAAAVTNVCTGTVTYDWGANGEAAAFTSATVGDITITQTSTVNFGASGAANNFQTRTTTSGNHAGYYSMTMDGPNGSDNEALGDRVVFTFSQPVRQLSFSMLDVDWTNNAWEDQMLVIGQDAAGKVVPFTLTPGTANQIAGNQVEGDAAAGQTETTGNVAYVFDGAVKTLTIEYTQGNEPTTNGAFQIVGVSDFTFCAFDYGDAPNTYGTQLAGGARHVLGDRGLYLGTNPPDGEANGQPAAAATTDDTTVVSGVDDEDGVASFPAYVAPATTYTVSVRAVNLSTTQAASLVGYIDWNRDGDFADANERSATRSVPANTTTATAFNVTWSAVPANAGGTTATYARFRIAFAAAEAQSPTGLAASGEVEDYTISAGTLPVTLSSFFSERSRGGLAVTWTTATETATIGYTVSGWDGRSWQPLTRRLIPSRALDVLVPQRYELHFLDKGYTRLRLEDVSLTGERTLHGPYALGTLYGREPEVHRIDWEAVHAGHELAGEVRRSLAGLQALAAAAISAASGTPLAELRIAQEGLYRVSYEDLSAAGVDLARMPVDRLELVQARSGARVPIWVQGSTANPSQLGPGGAIEFRGSPVTGSLYTKTRVYRLVAVSGGERVISRDAAPAAPAGPKTYSEVAETNRDLAYNFASPNGDPWYEAPVLAQGSNSAERSFPITADAPGGSEGRLRVDLWGVTDWPGDAPDHHVLLAFNGTVLKEERFDGLTARSYDLALPPGLLLPGTNQLTVRVIGDTGNAFDLVHVDRYALTYPRLLLARDGRLTFPSKAGETFAVDGLRSPQVTVYAQDGKLRLTGVEVVPSSSGYLARFTAPPAAAKLVPQKIDVVDAAAFLRPALELPRPARADLLTGRADYLIVAHPDFLDGLDDLVAARESQGHRVKVVDVFDLYQLYSGGEIDPTAIKTFVAQAAKRLGARSVLLVGGDSYDYFNSLGAGSISFVPTLYTQTDSLIHFSPADSLFGDVDGDGVQDLAVGRLPARTPSELRLLIEKILRYPRTPAGAVFAADTSEIRSFSAMSESFASQVPAGWPVTRAYVDQLGVAAARGQLLNAFNQGSALVSFAGHSGPTVWTFQGLFAAADSAALTNSASPAAVVQWGCWNTYYVAPQYDTLAHRLLLAGPQGAAVVVGSSTLSQESSDERMGAELVPRLLQRGTTIGDAIVQAKQAVARNPGGDRRDVLLGWTLLGDPALVVNP